MKEIDRMNAKIAEVLIQKDFKVPALSVEDKKKGKRMPYYVSLDLEMNKSTDDNDSGEITDIIQIGACIICVKSNKVIDTFNRYIKVVTPMENGELRISQFIKGLTGINDDIIQKEGIPLIQAVIDLYDFCKKHDVNRNGLEWGYDDFSFLKKKYIEQGGDLAFWYFVPSQFDIKKIYQTYRIANNQKPFSGLSASIKKIGFNFYGRKHNALCDSFNTAVAWLILMNKMSDQKP